MFNNNMTNLFVTDALLQSPMLDVTQGKPNYYFFHAVDYSWLWR